MKTGQGVLAEYAVVEKTLLTKKPSNVSFEEASSFPLSTFTAYSCLIETGKLTKGKGQRVFIVRFLHFLPQS
jgi:NADPH:quinone reductase-like Zn-dependent oxidoreductase